MASSAHPFNSSTKVVTPAHVHARAHTFTHKPLASQAPRKTCNAAREQSGWSEVCEIQTPGLSYWVWSPGGRAILSPKEGRPEGREGTAVAGPHGLHGGRTWSSGPPRGRGSPGEPLWSHAGPSGDRRGRGVLASLHLLLGPWRARSPLHCPPSGPRVCWGGAFLLQPAWPPPTRAASCRWTPLNQVLGVHPSPKAPC